MFHLLNRFKNIEVGHFTRRRKLPHSTLRVTFGHDVNGKHVKKLDFRIGPEFGLI